MFLIFTSFSSYTVSGNEFAWKDDQEFGRQMLAGINPNVIKCLRVNIYILFLTRGAVINYAIMVC